MALTYQEGVAYRPAYESVPLLPYTVGEALRLAGHRNAERTALVEGPSGRRWTYAELLRDAESTARGLLTRFAPGEHVAVWSGNTPERVLAEFGAALAGLVLVPVDREAGIAELEFVLKRSGATGLLVQADRAAVAATAVREIVTLGSIGAPAGRRLPPVAADDVAQIQYTAGSKGALLTHRALINGGYLYASAIGARPGDVWVDHLPLSRTSVVTLGALQTGGVHTLVQDEDPEHGTIMVTDPATLAEMLDAGRDLSAFTIVSLSEQPDPELIQRARGVRLGIGYGRPEASVIAHTAVGETAARPLPRFEVRIVDPATRATLAVGEVGEIVTRGVAVMRAYYRDHETKVFDAQGWLRTGDRGAMDECGCLRMTAPRRQISSTGERAAAYGARI
nr:AMP-binding protein [uncultured Actinoplanes sp.]